MKIKEMIGQEKYVASFVEVWISREMCQVDTRYKIVRWSDIERFGIEEGVYSYEFGTFMSEMSDEMVVYETERILVDKEFETERRITAISDEPFGIIVMVREDVDGEVKRWSEIIKAKPRKIDIEFVKEIYK